MLNRLIVRTSSSAWLFVGTLAVTFATLRSLTHIGRVLFPPEAGGSEPFDLQNFLTSEQVLAQLPTYTDRAHQLYYAFTAIDYVFPFAAGLFMAATAAFCLRHSFPAFYATLNARNLLPLIMLGTLFDWCENVAAITAIAASPGTTATMAIAVVTAKKLKLGFLVVSQVLVALLLVVTAVLAIARAVRKRRA
jgi:hypothetical protein